MHNGRIGGLVILWGGRNPGYTCIYMKEQGKLLNRELKSHAYHNTVATSTSKIMKMVILVETRVYFTITSTLIY
jgi:hypothetical protein